MIKKNNNIETKKERMQKIDKQIKRNNIINAVVSGLFVVAGILSAIFTTGTLQIVLPLLLVCTPVISSRIVGAFNNDLKDQKEKLEYNTSLSSRPLNKDEISLNNTAFAIREPIENLENSKNTNDNEMSL